MTATAPLFKIRDLEVQYEVANAAIKAVDRVAIEMGERDCVAIIGESGSGKSTIASAILRVLPENGRITGGEIFFKGRPLLNLSEEEMRKLRGKDISVVFQDPHSFLNPVLKIGDHLRETIKTHRPDIGRGKVAERALELLSLVKIPDPGSILNRYPYQLSGGMAQRVAIALGLSSDPALLIADEPTSALDLTIQAQVLKLLKGLIDLLHLSVLLITHDLSLVSNIAERVYVMYAGKIVEEDQVDNLYRDPRHPYTVMLLEAVKKLQGSDSSLRPASESGEGREGSLCAFLPRCPSRKPVCRERAPQYIEFPKGKKILCWNQEIGRQA
jgi:oligopeptide/dipeptide ABC transporter ATP-binding protein